MAIIGKRVWQKIGSGVVLMMFAVVGLSAQDHNEQSVKPGINDTWKSDEIEPLVDRLEAESREIYINREKLVDLVGPGPGTAVADIGAGSGFISMLFAEKVTAAGKVYAVDINPVMMERVADLAREKGIHHLETVVCGERSVTLPPNSVDLIFICDTYHHFEYPKSTMRSIYQALKPGGQLVLVDFKRIPGESEDWILKHVRAGQEIFTREIVDSGFKVVEEHEAPFLIENYVVRFAKIQKP